MSLTGEVKKNAQANHLGPYGHFLQWEVLEEVHRELLAMQEGGVG